MPGGSGPDDPAPAGGAVLVPAEATAVTGLAPGGLNVSRWSSGDAAAAAAAAGATAGDGDGAARAGVAWGLPPTLSVALTVIEPHVLCCVRFP